jgi:kynurenine 3-monooxygenase
MRGAEDAMTTSNPASSDASSNRAVVVGAGPVGCVLALVLQQQGLDVTVFEKRPDMRRADVAAGRSINLVLTKRGMRALRILGIADTVLELTVPVFGRMMHDLQGELTYTAYGKDDGEKNHSVSRGELNIALLNSVAAAGIPIHFDLGLERADLSQPDSIALTFTGPGGERHETTPRAFGADGAGSRLRSALLEHTSGELETEACDGYKELLFPAGPDGTYSMDQRALHIWPRGRQMLMGLPNQDGSFTGTIYMPYEGPESFESVSDPAKAKAFFEEHYPDAIPHLEENFAEELVAAPLGKLATTRCFPWTLEDRVMLVGDAAHPIVPFFGQGLNSGFEDVAVLSELLEAAGGFSAQLFADYQAARKPAGDAIAAMALENYVEMSDKVGDPAFILKKRVEARVEQALAPRYRTRYACVVYSGIPYHKAQELGRINERILNELCEGISTPEEADLERAAALVAEHLTPFVEAEGLDLEF